MSNVDKPFLYPARTESFDPVNFNKIVTYRKSSLDENKLGGSNKGKKKYQIVFQSAEMAVGSVAGEITWHYENEECRDKDFDDLRATVGTTVKPEETV